MSVEVIVDNREALPVRTLPFVSGWMLSPDVVAMTFANTDHWNTRLEGLSAYHLRPDGQYAPMLPKEWDGIEADLQILSKKLKQGESFEQESYPEWRIRSIAMLPPRCFVWKKEFEQAFKRSYSRYKYIIVNERPGDRELNFVPRIPLELVDLVMQGFKDGVTPVGSVQNIAMDTNGNVKPGRREKQQSAILEVIEELGYQAMAIPDGGKAKIKSILLGRPQMFTPSGFDHAWHLGVEEKLFRLMNHDKFCKR